MVRLSLAARLTLIVVVALTAAWLGAIAISFRSNDVAGRGARPSPRQIAALVHIIEQAPGEERPIILQAVDLQHLGCQAGARTGAARSGRRGCRGR